MRTTLAILMWLLASALAASSAARAADIRVQTDPGEGIVAGVYTGDGRLVATLGMNGSGSLWEAESGRLLRKLPCVKPASYANLQFLGADLAGARLLSIASGEVVVLDLVTGAVVRRQKLPGFYERSTSAATADGALSRIFAATTDGKVTIFHAETLKAEGELQTPAFPSSIAVSTSGGILVMGGKSGWVCAFDPRERRTLFAIEAADGHASKVIHVAVSGDGRRAASVGEADGVRLWEVPTGRLIRALPAAVHGKPVFTTEGRLLVLGEGDAAGRLFAVQPEDGSDLPTPPELPRWPNHGPKALASSPDGRAVLYAPDGFKFGLHAVATGREVRALAGAGFHLLELAIPPDESVALIHTSQSTLSNAVDSVRVVDLGSGHVLRELGPGKDFSVVGFALSPDGSRLALGVYPQESGKSEFGIRIYDWRTGAETGRFAVARKVNHLRWAPDGKRIIALEGSGGMHVLDAASGAESLRVQHGLKVSGISSVGVTPDGRRLFASGEADRPGPAEIVRLAWDATTGEPLAPPLERELASGALGSAVSPDGGARLHFLRETGLRLVDAESGAAIRTIAEGDINAKWAESCRFFAGGRLIAQADWSGALRIFETATGATVASFLADADGEWLAWIPDGRFSGSVKAAQTYVHVVDGTKAYALDQLFDRLFDPGAVRDRIAKAQAGEGLPAESTALTALSSAPKTGGVASIRSPPEVRFASPAGGARVSEAAVRVEVVVRDAGGGIGEVRLHLNGKLASEGTRGFSAAPGASKAGERAPAGVAGVPAEVRVGFDVLLAPGANVLSAVALSSDRLESRPAEIEVVLEGKKVAPSTLFVLSVGINVYRNPKYTLGFARPDAEAALAAIVTGSARIFAKVEPRSILDAEATRLHLEAAFREIAARARPEDAFAFFYAGHGVMSDGQGGKPAEFFLVPTDVVRLYGDEAGLEARAVPATLLKEWCRAVPAQKQLILIDACQAGGAVETFAMRGAAEERAIAQLARSAGVVLIAAAGTEQSASETRSLGHGIFTAALLEGLAGKADQGGDGKVTVTELKSWLEDRVPELTMQHRGAPQFPTGFTCGQDFPIAVK